MELHTTELSIYEIGLSPAPDTFSGQNHRRLECLYACLNATKSWVDVFLSIPSADFLGFSIFSYTGFVRCVVGMYRLSTFDHPEWDRTIAREKMDVLGFLEEVERRFSQVKDTAGLIVSNSENTQTFDTLASKVRALRLSWDGPTAPTLAPLNALMVDDTGDFPMSLLDDDWLSYLVGPANEQFA